MAKIPTLVVLAFSWVASAVAQEGDAGRLTDQMAGRELRVEQNDQVVGTILGVEPDAGGRPNVVVEIEETGKVVALALDRIDQRGGKYYIDAPPEQLAEQPASHAPAAQPSTTLPYGGMTPGWGAPPAMPR